MRSGRQRLLRGALLSVVIFVAGGACGGVLVSAARDRGGPSVARADTPHGDDGLPLATLIARAVAQGDTSCPDAPRVTRESCLIFQGALGVWFTFGMPDECPAMEPEPGVPSSSGLPERLRAPDVLRAVASPCFATIYAIRVANTVPILVSTPNRAFEQALTDDYRRANGDPEVALEIRHGICGAHAAVGIALLQEAGFEARAVEFYYSVDGQRRSHVLPEVLIDGSWRMVDTTYSANWLETRDAAIRLATTDDVVEQRRRPTNFNSALTPYELVAMRSGYDRFEYLMHDPWVVRGGAGDVGIDLVDGPNPERFADLPNFVGDNLIDDDSDGVRFALHAGDRTSLVLSVVVRAPAAEITNGVPASLCVDDDCQQYVPSQDTYRFDVTGDSTLRVATESEVAYLVLDSLSWYESP